MSYESAPATKMLATHCAICGRPLLDVNSVEAGMGPDCRAKYGKADVVDEAARKEGNVLVHRLALYRSEVFGGPSVAQVVGMLKRIRELNLSRLADVLEERLCDVQLELSEDRGEPCLALSTPFSERFVADLKSKAYLRRWDPTTSRWLVPPDEEARRLLWKVLKVHFKERLGRGPQGPFLIA